jgi:hypothetical protein
MFPVALGMVFGNVTKASLMSFCKFIVEQHPTSINKPDVTIITDRSKGSVAVINEYFPEAYHFHYSHYCTANILLNCRAESLSIPHIGYTGL